MADEPAYRFLPWTRRGLAAGLTAPDNPALPARAVVTVGITVTGAGDAGAQMKLYSPGDVAGVDPRVIVRMEPRPGATDVEPNYMAAIEFDPPDFPWMFTPAAPAAGERLRPWCVLVVLDQQVVPPPHLEPGVPLPVVEVPAGSVLTELPDLAESWAWAHTQVLTTASTAEALRAELGGAPDRQLSRILCPRRLQPGRRYSACLVPAFSIGVVRGLGGTPAEDAPLTPAWPLVPAQSVKLPVYYHWEFATGPEGDFESLARMLKPYKSDAAEVGVERMFVGDAGLGMPALDPADPRATLDQDGALRAPIAVPGRLDEVTSELRDGLRTVLNAASAELDGAPVGGAESLGPPLYGSWHINKHVVEGELPPWFEELNLDPRARVAAGLGVEVVRANQEAFMEVCWDQVGQVLDANEALSRARLAMEAGRYLHQRHFQVLPADMLTQLTSPLHERVRSGDSTVRSAIAVTSLPDAAMEPALRRATSGQRPVLKKAARRRGEVVPPSGTVRPLLARSLAAGRTDVDPTRFVPASLVDLDFLTATPTPSGGVVDLTSVGIPVQVTSDQLKVLSQRYQAVRAQPSARSPDIILRSNLPTSGVVTADHLAGIDAVVAPAPKTVVDRRSLLEELLTASVEKPGAVAYLLTVGSRSGEGRVDALDVDPRGEVLVRPPSGSAAVPVGTLPPTVAATSTGQLGSALANLPPNTIDRRGRTPTTLLGSGAAGAGLAPEAAPNLGSRAASTVEPPIRDPVVVGRFTSAFRNAAAGAELDRSEPDPLLVSFDLVNLHEVMLEQIDPVKTVPLRTATRIRLGGERFDLTPRPGVVVAPSFDRIMVAPSIVTPLYELLAEYDRDRLLPGVDRIPDDGITLLETNARFVAAFLAGANHEMNAELLWRRYPTDQRGTTLRRFWDWLDDGDDIPAIHTWNPAGLLGSENRGGMNGQLVLLVRGKLLRRYPNSVIYAWRALGGKLKDPPLESDLRPPVFGGRFAPDITYVGFDLTFEEITQGDGWFFVIQQQPTEPRFGFDEDPPEFAAVPPSWSDATWSDADVAPGRHLTLAGNPLEGAVRDQATFGKDAAHLAAVLLQKPMRVAIHGSQLAHLR